MPRIGFQSSTASRLRAGAKAEDVEFSGPITLTDAGLVYIELRPDLDYARIIGTGKPDRVVRGIIEGWSLPVFTVNEELFLNMCVPARWDAASNIIGHVYCYLDTANDGKKFGLRLAYASYTPTIDTVPDSSTNVDVQTSTGTAVEFQSFEVYFTIPYSGISIDDVLAFRLYRIDADPIGDEIAGDVVVTHIGAIFRRDKLGIVTP